MQQLVSHKQMSGCTQESLTTLHAYGKRSSSSCTSTLASSTWLQRGGSSQLLPAQFQRRVPRHADRLEAQVHKLSVEDAVLRARMLQLDKHLGQTEFHDSVLLDKVRLPGGQRLPAREPPQP